MTLSACIQAQCLPPENSRCADRLVPQQSCGSSGAGRPVPHQQQQTQPKQGGQVT